MLSKKEYKIMIFIGIFVCLLDLLIIYYNYKYHHYGSIVPMFFSLLLCVYSIRNLIKLYRKNFT